MSHQKVTEFKNKLYEKDIKHILQLRLTLMKKNMSESKYYQAYNAIQNLTLHQVKKLKQYDKDDLADKIIQFCQQS